MKKAQRNNRPAARIALIVFAAALVWLGLHVFADFRVSESGKVVFVPAATEANARQYTLTVRGLTRGEPGEQTGAIACLPGAEFGIYAMDAEGNMAPWPDPEAPYRAYRIRTEDEPVAFALPDRTEFYLLQESAPMGYQMAAQEYWKLGEQRELVLDNAMPGGAIITAVNASGEKQAGAKLCLTAQNQTRFEGVSGVDGTWTLGALPAGNYLLDSVQPPKGMLPAQDAQRVVVVRDATWTTAQMNYVEPGKLAVQAERVSVDQTGQIVRTPLAGLTCDVLDEQGNAAVSLDTGAPAKLVCDQRGWAQAALPSGNYTVRVDQRSAQGNLLQAEAYQVRVTDEKTSTVQVITGSPECRVRVRVLGQTAQSAEVPLGAVSVTLTREGKTYGPYPTDDSGAAMSEALPAGAYAVALTGLPDGYALPATVQANGVDLAWQTDALQAGPATLTEVEIACPAVRTGRFMLRAGALGDDGSLQPQPVGEVTLAVLDAHGQPVVGGDGQPLTVRTDADGGFALTLPAGQYAVAATKAQAGVLKNAPVVLTLPAEDGAVVLMPTPDARLIVRAVDDSGARLSGASYRVTDAQGKHGFDLVCDTTGQAVSPVLKPGTYHIQSIDNPVGFAPTEPVAIECAAGRFTERSLVHSEQGTLRITAWADTMDAQGEQRQTPLADVSVALLQLRDGGQADNAADYVPYPSEQTPLLLRTDAQGIAKIAGATPRLPAGYYRARVVAWPDGFTGAAEPQPVEVINGATNEGAVMAVSTLGGLKLTLTDAADPAKPLADAVFALYPADGRGAARQLTSDARGMMLALDMPEGEYILQQISSPDGYSPLSTQTIQVPSAQVINATLTNARQGVLAADKRGYTFNANMQAFRVPLPGKYGVFTQANGQYLPYPSEAGQYVLCANISPIIGEYSEVSLPAAPEGTAYYLCEVPGTATQGYVDDRSYHEVFVFSGQRTQAEIAATSDKGFFALTLSDGVTGASVSGGSFALFAPRTGGQAWEVEPALRFAAEGGSYQNEMAMPAGRYKLVMEQAPVGYMLDAQVAPVEAEIEIPPYMQQGNPMAQVGWMVTPVPTTAQALGGSIVPTARDGQILVAHDWQGGAPMPLSAVTLEAALTDRAAGITGVSVGQAKDRDGGALDAKIAYRLVDGGWRWDDVRTLPGIQQGAQQVSLADVPQRISAVRVWYVQQATGTPQVGASFVPGDVAITTAGPKSQTVETTYSYRVQYLDEQGQPVESAPRYTERAVVDMGGGQPAPIALADKQPGGVVGSVWLEQSPDDGYWDAAESAAGLPPITVQLLRSVNLNVVQETRTDEQGNYRFDVTEMGNYRVRFVLPDAYLPAPFKGNDAFASTIADAAQGMTDAFPISASQRWTNLCAGVVHAATAQGVVWLDNDQDGARGDEAGLPGVSVTLLKKTANGAEQLVAEAMTDDQGQYRFGGLTAGQYIVRFALPDSTVFAKGAPVSEKAGVGSLALSVTQGTVCDIAPVGMLKLGSIGGVIWTDADSDGQQGVDETAQANLRVELLDENLQAVLASTLTDVQGRYRFTGLRPGAYVVRATLRGQYTFTQGGAITHSEGTVGYTDPIRLAMGQDIADLNAGALIPTGVVVHAWGDDNYQGMRGAYEKGVRGVRVALLPADAAVPQDLSALDWRETAADGTVRYDRMNPGSYRLAYALPDGWQPTRRVASGDRASILPDDGQASGVTEPFAVASGVGAYRVEMGLMLPATVQGTAWMDGDDSGLRDAGESGLQGVTVWLENAETGAATEKVTTDADGQYTIGGLMPGKYTMRVKLPDGCVFTGNARSVAKGLPARADAQEGASAAPFAIAMGQSMDAMDIGAVRLGGLSGALWADEDYSGAHENGEQPLSGVTVTLYSAEGVREMPISETTSGTDGKFALPALRPGTYRLGFTLPEGFVPTREDAQDKRVAFLPHERNVVRTAPIALAAGEIIDDIALGALRLGTVSGTAWEDADYDGNRGDTEKPLRNVLVTLWRNGEQQDEQVASVLTDREGTYYFDGLQPDYYWLAFGLPEGYLFTREGGQSQMVPDDGAHVTETEVFHLGMGEAVTGIDIGALRPASMSGSVWLDSNNNGLPDPGEPGLADVGIRLLSDAETDRVAAEVLTDEQGVWRAEGLMPGTYTLTAELPQGHLFARGSARANIRASIIADVDATEGDAAPITLAHGEQMNGLYIGAVRSATFSGTVWCDGNDSGQYEDGDGRLEGVAVSLIGEGAPHETRTNAEGAYEFTDVRPGTYQLACDLPEGYLFARPKTQDQVALLYDESASSAQSKAFSMEQGEQRQAQDIGAVAQAVITAQVWMDADQDNARAGDEPGVEKTLVELLDATTGDVLATQRANNDGSVTFAALRAGGYQLRYTLPDGYILAEGTELTDLNALETEGSGPRIDLIAGQTADTAPVAAVLSVTIRGQVWEDTDATGLRETSEPPLPGTVVTLLGIGADGERTPLRTLDVDAYGRYTFASVRPGNYALRFALPGTYLFTNARVGTDDVSSKVPVPEGQVGETDPFVVTMGQELAHMDAGAIQPGVLGDTVWVDENGNGLQDYGEAPLPGVKLVLFRLYTGRAEQLVAETTSDEYGLYRFHAVRPGQYRLRVELPDGYTFTINRPDLSEIDSDVPETPGAAGDTEPFNIRSGETRRDIDVGAKKQ